MELVEEYKNKIIHNEVETGGYVYINKEAIGKLYKNVNVITFDKLYIQLFISFLDSGLMPLSESNNINNMRDYISGNLDKNINTWY